MMNSFLFVQWEKPTDASRYVIDGEASIYSGSELQDEVMRVILNVQNNKDICGRNGCEELSPSFRCSYSKYGSSYLNFIEGNFEETDVAGRKLVYVFATKENESENIVQILKDYSSLLGVTPNEADLKVVRNTNFKNEVTNTNNKTNNFKPWTIIITIISLLLYILLRLLSRL